MKKTIILSIKPIYSQQIIDGSKKYEYRTKRPNCEIDRILIYESCPTKMIIGEVLVKRIIKSSPKELWNMTNLYSGISKVKYNKYFKNRNIAYAYELGDVNLYEKKKLLSDYGVKSPPQSFVYLD